MGRSLENRARFPRQVVRAVREAVGDRVAVTAKLNMADGVPGGFWLDESLAFARLLETDGALDALELTGGSSLANPMYLFRGEAPIHEMAAVMPPAVRLMFRVVARRMMPEYPFEEAFFLPYARQFRAALTMPLILLGGITRRDTIERALAEGFSFVAMARALLREPDLIGRCGAARPASRCACTATSACRPSTAEPAACSSRRALACRRPRISTPSPLMRDPSAAAPAVRFGRGARWAVVLGASLAVAAMPVPAGITTQSWRCSRSSCSPSPA